MANTVEKGLVSKSALAAIGNAIRAKNGSTTKYKPSEMAAAISELKTGDFTVATSDKFTYKVVQTANQIINSTPAGKAVSNSDGTVSLALTDTTTISPNTNYIPGAIQRSYDDSTHTYTVTATDAEPIDGLVQDGWSVVYQKAPGENNFYFNNKYTGDYVEDYKLQGNILIGGMQKYSTSGFGYPGMDSHNISKFKNTFITSAGTNFLSSCESLIYAELPNLTKATGFSFLYKALVAYVELPNFVNAGPYLLQECKNLRSVELPKLTTADVGLLSGVDMSKSSPMYFVDFGYITENISVSALMYTTVIVLRADGVPTGFRQSNLSTPVLYIVPSALVDTYKAKVRSTDYVTALEKSPFADGKTVCGNNMKITFYGGMDGEEMEDLGDGNELHYRIFGDEWHYTYDTNPRQVMRAPENATGAGFYFLSKLTKEKGYTIPT